MVTVVTVKNAKSATVEDPNSGPGGSRQRWLQQSNSISPGQDRATPLSNNIATLPTIEPVVQARTPVAEGKTELLPFKERVIGSNPMRLMLSPGRFPHSATVMRISLDATGSFRPLKGAVDCKVKSLPHGAAKQLPRGPLARPPLPPLYARGCPLAVLRGTPGRSLAEVRGPSFCAPS
jgi:hypothetical protein